MLAREPVLEVAVELEVGGNKRGDNGRGPCRDGRNRDEIVPARHAPTRR